MKYAFLAAALVCQLVCAAEPTPQAGAVPTPTGLAGNYPQAPDSSVVLMSVDAIEKIVRARFAHPDGLQFRRVVGYGQSAERVYVLCGELRATNGPQGSQAFLPFVYRAGGEGPIIVDDANRYFVEQVLWPAFCLGKLEALGALVYTQPEPPQ